MTQLEGQTGNKASIKDLNELFQSLTVADEEQKVHDAVANIASFINGAIEELHAPTKAIHQIENMLRNKKDASSRQKALRTIEHIAASSCFSAAVEPYIVPLIPQVIEKVGDKDTDVRDAAIKAAKSIVHSANPYAVKAISPLICDSLRSASKWQEKICCLELLEILIKNAPSQLSRLTPDIVPVISEAMWDTKPEAQRAARKSMEELCTLISNNDIDRFIPALIDCIAHPEKVTQTIHLLGATTFVSEVQAPTLSIMVPLLARGLAERATEIKRKSAVIIDNMSKLVDDPIEVATFLPKLLPSLQHIKDTIGDPECREVVQRAIKTLSAAGNVVDGKIPDVTTSISPKVCAENLNKIVGENFFHDWAQPAVHYIASIAAQLVHEKNNDSSEWASHVMPYLAEICPQKKLQEVLDSFQFESIKALGETGTNIEEEEEGEDLCNCEFSLAYGAKILLNRTRLRLKKGRRYGLCGPNGSGKSTLMRAIVNNQVEGFPTHLRTVYVEHDIDATEAEMSTVEFIKSDPDVPDSAKVNIEEALRANSFTEELINKPIGSLSGGWKMKLALTRAMLKDPHILLLDEPTNHLDVVNVAWLENFLTGQKDVTSVIVSHDTKFLDNVVQSIVHYERFKLKKYLGNMSAFVKKVPSAKSYFELGASEMEFQFPEPGFLEGVKTKQKAIVKVSNMTFQYPGTSKPQIENISFQCSLSSRVAVIGPNGAGKSTLIKVLTGELVPSIGDVWTHPNLRIAYVAQHAFHHIDSHLDMTPSEYIQWRFQSGEDRETMDREARKVTEDDEKAMLKIWKIEGTERRISEVLSRRKLKNSYEYEVSWLLGANIGTKSEKWTQMMSVDNAWISRNELIETHSKMVAEVDLKAAQAAGQFRPLVRAEIESHCLNLGLDAEIVSHSHIRGLSGGQKVKLVLAACTWQRPHLVVLDEPTNYLDRESLGALSKALKAFEGGVIIITHSQEFTQDLTDEVWAVQHGQMTPSGHNWVKGQGSGPRLEDKENTEEEKFDAMGNKLESSNKKKKLTGAELRKKKKDRIARRKRGEEVFSDEDD